MAITLDDIKLAVSQIKALGQKLPVSVLKVIKEDKINYTVTFKDVGETVWEIFNRKFKIMFVENTRDPRTRHLPSYDKGLKVFYEPIMIKLERLKNELQTLCEKDLMLTTHHGPPQARKDPITKVVQHLRQRAHGIMLSSWQHCKANVHPSKGKKVKKMHATKSAASSRQLPLEAPNKPHAEVIEVADFLNELHSHFDVENVADIQAKKSNISIKQGKTSANKRKRAHKQHEKLLANGASKTDATTEPESDSHSTLLPNRKLHIQPMLGLQNDEHQALTMDNMLANNVMAWTLARILPKRYPEVHFAPENSQIRYLACVINLVVQKMLNSLDDTNDPDLSDYYFSQKFLPIHYNIDEDQEAMTYDGPEHAAEDEKSCARLVMICIPRLTRVGSTEANRQYAFDLHKGDSYYVVVKDSDIAMCLAHVRVDEDLARSDCQDNLKPDSTKGHSCWSHQAADLLCQGTRLSFTVLVTTFCQTWFEALGNDVKKKAKQLFEHVCEEYVELATKNQDSKQQAKHKDITIAQEHDKDFEVIALMTRDFLTMPGASVAIERLFSGSHHACADTHIFMRPSEN
ncbi:hypothetical protein CERSUDRAFT_74181 [Gelatoporia subvermispora B]|uniref:HAT C-terminal dimerisation domain-containing protein n=1 Tax=Ceriporiopsis subvermispora (strain B) TaxID=914234 RepID=M2REE6_CERS8|nr:hypothetical protein CERSUDRAFT_74181 [Gelatoporia subvermispora B]